MTRGLILGRFQPFHLGHMELIKSMIRKNILPIICIGSAQHSNTLENPFTADERGKMIVAVMECLNCEYELYQVPDINNYDLYVSHLKTFVSDFDLVCSGNSLVQRLFTEAGDVVIKPKIINREAWEGSAIRLAMKAGGDWEAAVPIQVVEIINRIDGSERLKNLT